jgi:predicted DNA-binding ribbon-helix-helix protein
MNFHAVEFSTRHRYRVYKRNGTETSVLLEAEVLGGLRYLAFQWGITVQEVLRRIDGTPRASGQSFASAIRCYAIRQLMCEVLDLSAPKPPRKGARR